MVTASDEHPLLPLVQERLVALGLDEQVFAPYLLAFFPTDQSVENDDDWDSVLELLQASSEHDDASVWTTLQHDLCTAWQEHVQVALETQQAMHLEQERLLRESLARAALEQQQPAEAKSTLDPAALAAKQAMIARYGYEEDHEEIVEEAKKLPVATAATTNSQPVVATKQDERRKTKEAVLQKEKLKEERRKRAQKGERKR
jgi:outer membrane biosynthesis protein TonB